MHTRLALGVLFALILLFLSPAAFALCLLGEEVQLVSNGANHRYPSIYGDRVVYDANRNNQVDINAFSLLDMDERQITTDPAVQSAPVVYDNTVIWQDSRAPTTDIYRYDLAAQAEYALATQSVQEYEPRVDGNIIVWRTGGGAQIYTCNLVLNGSSGGCLAADVKTIVHDKNYNLQPDVYGTRIVWADGNVLTKYAIYTCDIQLDGSAGGCLAGDKKTVLTDYNAMRGIVHIHGNTIVWQQKPSLATASYYDIYRYDLSTMTAYPVSTAPQVQEYPDVYGDIIAWDSNEAGNFDIYMCQLSLNGSAGGCLEADAKTQVTTDPADQTKPAIYENKIVWEDARTGANYKSIYMMPLACGGLSNNKALWLGGDVTSVSWGNSETDDYLDLATGRYVEYNIVYKSSDGDFSPTSVWSDGLYDDTWDVAWGDVDRDGDLDLAVGNGTDYTGDKVYAGTATGLTANLIFNAGTIDATRAIAFADVDNDGDLDLAVGNIGAPNVIYKNVDGNLTTEVLWSDGRDDNTLAIAFADVDNDGYLELAVGNTSQANYVYDNVNGVLSTTALWSDGRNDDTQTIAFGDIDNDGYLELVVGNEGQNNYVYDNVNGILSTTPMWSDGRNDFTQSIAAADIDNDGYIELAVGNENNEVDTIYDNINGSLGSRMQWNPLILDSTMSITLLDVNKDGDLDLAVGNWDPYDTTIYTNVEADLGNPNIAPTAPATGLTANYSCRERKLNIAWGEASDDKTPAQSLYYNISVGTTTGSQNIVSGIYGQSGESAYFGNGMLVNFRNLKLPNADYYWAVQAIDGGLAPSLWGTEQFSPADAPPIISTATFDVNEDSGFHNNLIDLWQYASDNSTADENLVYAITIQTNPAVVSCVLDQNRYIDCTAQPDQNGYSDVGVSIRDECDQTDETSFRINVLSVNDAPTAQITSPANGSSVQDVNTTFTGSATDPEDGNISGASLVWSSSIDGALGTGSSVTPALLSQGTHTITLTATDSGGLQGTANITVNVCVLPRDGLVITQNTTLCASPHYAPDVNNDGAIAIDGNNLTLDCANANIYGDGTGKGIVVNGYIPAEWYVDGNTERELDANKIISDEAGFEASIAYKQNITLKNCELSGYEHGFAITGGDGITVQNVTAHDNAGAGIGFQGLKNSTIKNNIAYNNAKGGIGVMAGRNNVIELNEAYGNGGVGIASAGREDIIRNNNVHDNESGIAILGADMQVTNNTVLNNNLGGGENSYGIVALFATGAQITGNDVQNSPFGIRMLSSNEMTVEDNNVSGATTGIGIGAWLFTAGDLNKGTFRNNRVLNSTKAGMYLTDGVFGIGNKFGIHDLVLQGNYFENPGVWDLHLDDRGTSYLWGVRVGAGESIRDMNVSVNSFMGGGVQAAENMNSFCVGGVGNAYGAEAQQAPGDCPS